MEKCHGDPPWSLRFLDYQRIFSKEIAQQKVQGEIIQICDPFVPGRSQEKKPMGKKYNGERMRVNVLSSRFHLNIYATFFSYI